MNTPKNRKSVLIPDGWKGSIDEILTKELLGANRYFAQSNPLLRNLVEEQARKDPVTFYEELVNRWNWHNVFFEELLEPALNDLLPRTVFDLTEERVVELGKMYAVASLIDQATLIPTAAIKKHIEYWTSWLQQKMMLSDAEATLLLTPPTPSFWATYMADHLELFLAGRKRKKTEDLLQKYHAGDKLIFEGRLANLSAFRNSSPKVIRERISKTRGSVAKRVEHFYFAMERPYVSALARTITYDNTDEYSMLTTLVGISGYVLRRAVLTLLNDTKIILNTGAIYALDDNQVAEGLEKLHVYRKELMVKNVTPFRQSTPYTCGAASLTMILHHLELTELSVKTEHAIYEASAAKLIPGTHFSGLQKYADCHGLETQLIHSESGMFQNGNAYLDPETFSALMAEYQGFIDNCGPCAVVRNGVPITPELITSLLNDDYLVILAGMCGMLHAVVVSGYNQHGFVVCDPLSRKQENWSSGQMRRFSSTPIGSWLLAIRKNQSARTNLLKSLPQFEREAKGFLKK